MRWVALAAVAYLAAACASAADPPAPVIAASPSVNGAILDAATGRPVGHVTTDGPITGAAPDGRGGWYIAGGFSAVDGVSRPHLAHIRADGSGASCDGWPGRA